MPGTRVSVWFTFLLLSNFGVAAWRLGTGTAMDISAFHALIAQVRGTTAELAAAEQKVAAFKAELARQAHGAQNDASSAAVTPLIPKRARSGWLPATG